MKLSPVQTQIVNEALRRAPRYLVIKAVSMLSHRSFAKAAEVVGGNADNSRTNYQTQLKHHNEKTHKRLNELLDFMRPGWHVSTAFKKGCLSIAAREMVEKNFGDRNLAIYQANVKATEYRHDGDEVSARRMLRIVEELLQ